MADRYIIFVLNSAFNCDFKPFSKNNQKPLQKVPFYCLLCQSTAEYFPFLVTAIYITKSLSQCQDLSVCEHSHWFYSFQFLRQSLITPGMSQIFLHSRGWPGTSDPLFYSPWDYRLVLSRLKHIPVYTRAYVVLRMESMVSYRLSTLLTDL